MSRYGVPFSKGPEVRLDPHPDSCELSQVAELAQKLGGRLAIDLFSGAGGLSLGLHLAGFNVVLAADKEREAAETHRAHFPGASLCVDLSDPARLTEIIEGLGGIELDLVAGGPPCQPYSQAAFSKVRHLERFHGRQQDSRRTLWSNFVEVIEKTRPRAVLVENVPDMAFGRDGIVLRTLVADLEELGYHVHTRVLASDAYGVPQHRQRLFMVAFRDSLKFSWPTKDESGARKLEDAIGDLPPVEGGDKQERRPYLGCPSAMQAYFRNGLPESESNFVYDQYTRSVRPDDLEAFKLMDSNTKYSDLPNELKRYRDDIFDDKYKRLDMQKLSRTITAHISQDGYWYIHPIQHRTLTIREAARIQTFPDRFRFCGYPRHAFKQIGEAVPPLFAKAVGLAIMSALEANETATVHATRDIASAATRWFESEEPARCKQPWLKELDPWRKTLGSILFDRASAGLVLKHYAETLDRWPTAQHLVDDLSAVSFAESRFKADPFFVLQRLSRLWPEEGELTLELLDKVGLAPSASGRLLASLGILSSRPLNAGLQRVAVRFWGMVTGPEDGRGTYEMRLGRMTGADETGSVYCAIQEIAVRFCKPAAPSCESCPFAGLCATAKQAKTDHLFACDEFVEAVATPMPISC